MRDGIYNEVYRVGVVDVYRSRQGVRDLVLAGMPITITESDEHGSALNGRLAARVAHVREVVIGVRERKTLKRQVLDPVGRRSSCDVDHLFDNRSLHVRRRHVLARPDVIVEGPPGLVEVELTGRIQEFESVEKSVSTGNAKARIPTRQLRNRPIRLLQKQ